MRRLSISNKGMFIPEEGEIFFSEVPNKGMDRKVKTLVERNNDPCRRCVFSQGKLSPLCFQIMCLEDGEQYMFRRVRDGEI